DAREPAAQRQRHRLADRLLMLNEDHVRPGDHDLADYGVSKFEYRTNHLSLARFDLRASLDEIDDAAELLAGVHVPVGRRAAGRRRGAGAQVPRASSGGSGRSARRTGRSSRAAVAAPRAARRLPMARGPPPISTYRAMSKTPPAGRKTCQPPPSQCARASVTSTAAPTSAHTRRRVSRLVYCARPSVATRDRAACAPPHQPPGGISTRAATSSDTGGR